MKTMNLRKTNLYESTKSQFITTVLYSMLFTPLLFLGEGLGVRCSAQNVGISATGVNPDNSAMLDVTSNTKGMLIPRMTGDEKYAIPSPATGLLIFQTDTAGFWYYDGTKWIPLVSSTSSTASPSNAGWLTTGNIGTAWNKNFLGTTDNVSLRLRTNNVERMIVDSLGRVGIGTSAPAYKFHVAGGRTFLQNTTVAGGDVWATQSATFRDDRSMAQNVGGGITFEGLYGGVSVYSTFGWIRGFKDNATSGDIYGGLLFSTRLGDMIFKTQTGTGVLDDLTTGQSMIIKANGNVGIGTTNPGAYKCYINGTGYLNAAAWVYSSDRRLKENIKDIPSGLNIISQLKPETFDYIDGEKKQAGFIAQEVQTVLPNIVTKRPDGMLGMKTDEIIPYLVKAMQEQQQIIDSLKSGKDNAEARIAKLEAAINLLLQQSTTVEVKK